MGDVVSTPRDGPSAPPAISPACQEQISSAFDTGKWADATNPLYAGINAVVGVPLADATTNDFQRLFVCVEAFPEKCKDLKFPSFCTAPPCDQCGVYTAPAPPPRPVPTTTIVKETTAPPPIIIEDSPPPIIIEDSPPPIIIEESPPATQDSFVPEACEKHLDWAVSTGKRSSPGSYRKMKQVSGVEVAAATKEDFQRLFACEGMQESDCNRQGLELPTTCSSPPCNVCPGKKEYTPSMVTVDGYNLYVNGELFHINGVCWSPVPAGSGLDGALYSEWSVLDAPKMAEAGMNAVRPYGTITDLSVLDTLYANGLMVTVPIWDVFGSATEQDIANVVNKVKDHPAVLMWTLGNEWNLNTFYNDKLSVQDCAEWIKMASAVIKKLDKNHPIATVYGDVPPAIESMVPLLPDIDIWSLNAYRFDSFRGLFDQWESMNMNKPLFLGEFGADAWDSSPSAGGTWDPETMVTTGGKYNPESQAETTRKLLAEIYRGSTKTPEGPKVGSGGFIFEWSDEYWKRGDWSKQESEGLAPCPQGCGPAPDRSWNEDYWGISGISRDYSQCGSEFDADTSCPLRQAYYVYKNSVKP